MVMVSLAESSGIPSRKHLWILFSQRNAHKPRTSLLEEVKWFWIYTNMKVKKCGVLGVQHIWKYQGLRSTWKQRENTGCCLQPSL